MPLVDIEIVGDADNDTVPAEMLQLLTDQIGRAFSSRPSGTWVRLHYLPRSQYAENGGAVSVDILPVFVSVIQARSDPSTRSRLALQLAETIARALNRPTENIHIIFEADATGRLAFGGQLVTS